MIQRIQSLLLLGVVIVLTINLFVPVWTSKDAGVPIKLTAFSITKATKPLPIIEKPLINQQKDTYYIGSLIIACIGLTVYIIFQYTNRVKQLTYCNLLTILILIVIGSYFIAIPAAKSMMVLPNDGDYEIGYFLPLIAALLTLAARYYIRKDEELVKDSNRMR